MIKIMILGGAAAFIALSPKAFAFHDGGVGACNGCHTIHNSPDNPVVPGATPNSKLMKASDPSSICLNCHAGPGSSTSPSVFSADGSAKTPGGDFYWLTKTFSWTVGSSSGDSHGHNIIARDFGLLQDSRLNQAPGGSYQAAFLGCTSCHDPHGRVNGGVRSGTPPVSVTGSYGSLPSPLTVSGNYRLLGDSQYTGGSLGMGYQFAQDAPVARQSDTNNYGESDSSHVDYGSGMSEWCANCHADMLNNDHIAGTGFAHPVGNSAKLEQVFIDTYNSYLRTGELAGIVDTAYLQFVPFERGVQDRTLLDPNSTRGPDANSNVMCLTCHRAHGSAFRALGRWDFDAVLLVDSHPTAGDSGVTGSDVLDSYYGRAIAGEFGSGQRSFCEKCHGAAFP
jgi:hypothetical protein